MSTTVTQSQLREVVIDYCGFMNIEPRYVRIENITYLSNEDSPDHIEITEDYGDSLGLFHSIDAAYLYFRCECDRLVEESEEEK